MEKINLDTMKRMEKAHLEARRRFMQPQMFRLDAETHEKFTAECQQVASYNDGPSQNHKDGFMGLPIDLTSHLSHLLCEDGTQWFLYFK